MPVLSRGNAPRRRLLLSLILAAACLPPALLAAPVPMSLDEAVARALQRAPSLDAERARVEAAREESRRAGAMPDPMLSVGIDNLPATGTDAFDPDADFMTMKKIGLRQAIPSRAKRQAQRLRASRDVDAANVEADNERVAVQRAAALAWLEAWTTQHELEALRRLRDQAGDAADLARAGVAGGTRSAADALATRAAVLDLDNRIAAAEAQHAAAIAALQRWSGEGEVALADHAPDFSQLPYTQAGVLAALDRLPALRSATAELETAAAEIDLARAERRPDWSIATAYGQRSDGRDDMLTVEVEVGLPLFARHRQDRGVAARRAEYDAVIATREDLRRQLAADVRGAFARWEGLLRQEVLFEDDVLPLARDRSAVALAAWRAGGDLQPWLDARRDELASTRDHIAHMGELGRAWVALAYLFPAETQP